MSILIDTNVLLRRTQPSHPSYSVALDSVAMFLAAGEPGYLMMQNENSGTSRLGRLLIKIERSLSVLPDAPEVYGE
jgi:hypothetical protein